MAHNPREMDVIIAVSEIIRSNPGVTVSEIVSKADAAFSNGVVYGATRYLTKKGMIKRIRNKEHVSGGSPFRHYPADAKLTKAYQPRNDTTEGQVLELIRQNPGISNRELREKYKPNDTDDRCIVAHVLTALHNNGAVFRVSKVFRNPQNGSSWRAFCYWDAAAGIPPDETESITDSNVFEQENVSDAFAAIYELALPFLRISNTVSLSDYKSLLTEAEAILRKFGDGIGHQESLLVANKICALLRQ